jgi:hypothetical protein
MYFSTIKYMALTPTKEDINIQPSTPAWSRQHHWWLDGTRTEHQLGDEAPSALVASRKTMAPNHG